jgi:hypothetical protein
MKQENEVTFYVGGEIPSRFRLDTTAEEIAETLKDHRRISMEQVAKEFDSLEDFKAKILGIPRSDK